MSPEMAVLEKAGVPAEAECLVAHGSFWTSLPRQTIQADAQIRGVAQRVTHVDPKV